MYYKMHTLSIINMIKLIFVLVILFFVIKNIIGFFIDKILFQPEKCNKVIPSSIKIIDSLLLRTENDIRSYNVTNDFVRTKDDQSIHYIFIKNPKSEYV